MLSTTRLRINALTVGQRSFSSTLNHPAVTSLRSTWLCPASRRGLVQRAAVPQAKRSAYVYPELVQIYRAPTAQTGANGIGRVVTIGLFLASIPLAANIYGNPDASSWWIPVVLLGATIPMTLTILLCGPWTMAIQLNLPSRARRSAEDLRRFVSRLPPDAALAIQFLRWKPWPTTRQMSFVDLRRLPPSRVRMSNLEHLPEAIATKMQNDGRLRAWIVRRYMGQFWVVMDDESGGKGVIKDVWKQVWEQIPMAGDLTMGKAKGIGLAPEDSVTSDAAVRAELMIPEEGSVSASAKSRRPPPPPIQQSVGRKRR